ncbi:hypothetical protein BGW37DRAFT_304462 [Umbelopsis sp. PMI_123]|nr:hypothetical protein BGW37DRAFT_304462 [Umbelopsis sp. PMI_123]
MQRDILRKAFTLSHERFVIEVDPSKRLLQGYAELSILPLQPNLDNVQINFKQGSITHVSVNGDPAQYVYKDPLTDVTMGPNTTIANHQSYKGKYLTALKDADEGELKITIPNDAVVQAKGDDAFLETAAILPTAINRSEPSAPQTPGGSSTITNYAPITIRIDYVVESPSAGVIFVEPDPDVAPYRDRHVYTTNQPMSGGTRMWLPCVDKISERCMWDMIFIVPQKMTFSEDDVYDESTNDVFQEDENTVVCSGEIMEQTTHPTDPSKKIVHYSLTVPTAAPFIGFAIGPFEMIKLSTEDLQLEIVADGELGINQKQSAMTGINMMPDIYAFCLPGLVDELTNSTSFLAHAMHFYSQEYGTYPFVNYKLVVVEEAWDPVMSCASMSICSVSLLHPPEVIDQTYDTRRELSIALAAQWFGVHIVQKVWSDIWLIASLAHHMASIFLRKHLGNNEYRLRLKKDMLRCVALDVNRPPIFNSMLPAPLDQDDLDFITLKGPLVLYILDRRMTKAGSTRGLSRVIPKILVEAMSGELTLNALSTHWFLRQCRKVSGYDTKTFAEQWIYGSGCPKFTFKYHFNRKKMVVEIDMTQENSSAASAPPADTITDVNNTMAFQDTVTTIFTGNFIARIHEADGTPYEHILDIQTSAKRFEVQFNTKYKRIRRNTKRFQAKQAAAAAAAAEEEQMEGEEGEAVSSIVPSLGLGMPLFEEDQYRQEWRLVEWGQEEDDTSGAASATFDWIRLDAEFEWICTIKFEQPDYMWAAQLTKDWDVVAQYEALEALKTMPSPMTSTSLLRAIMDQRCFYRIRMQAATALARCARPDINWIGLLQLTKIFQKKYCFTPANEDAFIDPVLPMVQCIPRPNNFSNLVDYFLQKAVVAAFALIRDENGLCPLPVCKLLLDLLKYNDNTGNEMEDSYYVCALINAVADAVMPISSVDPDLVDPKRRMFVDAAIAEIERYRTRDIVIPSYRNIVTVNCLQVYTGFMLSGLMKTDLMLFMNYSRYGNYEDIRIVAFDSILLLCGLSDSTILKYMLDIAQHDPSAYIRHYVARALLVALGLMIRGNNRDNSAVEEFAEEEGRVIIEDAWRKRPNGLVEFHKAINDIRAIFSTNYELQHYLWETLNNKAATRLDHRVLKYILQFCEYAYKPVDVGLKVTIRVPSLPASQAAEETENTPSSRATASPVSETPKITIPMPAPTPPPAIVSGTPTTPTTVTISKPSKPKEPKAPKPTAPITDGMPFEDLKKAKRILNRLLKHKASFWFRQPVDPIRDGAPDYFKYVKTPMDLGTVQTKLDGSQYRTLKEFENDIRLVFSNCYVFNPRGTEVYNEGQALEALYEKEWAKINGQGKGGDFNMTIIESPVQTPTEVTPISQSKSTSTPTPTPKPTVVTKSPTVSKPAAATKQASTAPDRVQTVAASTPTAVTTSSPVTIKAKPPTPKITNGAVKTEKTPMELCQGILQKILQNKLSAEFRQPVDPELQGIPHYRQIITNPMDFGTVKTKLKKGKYANPREFDNDMRLVFRNCYTFNPPDNPVFQQCKLLEKDYTKLWQLHIGNKTSPDSSASVEASVSPTPAAKINVPAAAPRSHAASVPPKAATMSPVAKQAPRPASVGPENTSVSIPSNSTAPLDMTMNPLNYSKCERILQKLIDNPAALPFLQPVDPVALGIPMYFDIIKVPMDLGTIRNKLSDQTYQTVDQFEQDVRQIFWNCFRFNMAGSWVEQQGRELEGVFNDLFAGDYARPGTLTPTEHKSARGVLFKLMTHEAATIFLEPVDANILPNYYTVIKKPMDFRTISEKLTFPKYSNLEELAADIEQIFTNCFTYNAPGVWGHNQGKKLQKYFSSLVSKDAVIISFLVYNNPIIMNHPLTCKHL